MHRQTDRQLCTRLFLDKGSGEYRQRPLPVVIRGQCRVCMRRGGNKLAGGMLLTERCRTLKGPALLLSSVIVYDNYVNN